MRQLAPPIMLTLCGFRVSTIEVILSFSSNINVVGTNGSGKSTFGKELASKLNLPYIEMDSLFWKPNWVQSNDDEFFSKLEAALTTDSWVLDGNYSRTAPLKWTKVKTIIWLDYSFSRTLYQAAKRAVKRSISKQEIWPGTGNVETFRKLLFSKDSIVLWTLKTYHSNRTKYIAMMESEKYSHINFVRLSSPKQARNYINEL